MNSAYDLFPEYANWQQNQTTVLVFLRKTTESDESYIARATQHLGEAARSDLEKGIFDRAILVAQDYWLEYVSGTKNAPEDTEADYALPVKSEAPSTARITAGSGINLQF